MELHKQVAAKIHDNPALFDVAIENLGRWLAHSDSDDAIIEWDNFIQTHSREEVLDLSALGLMNPDECGNPVLFVVSSPLKNVTTYSNVMNRSELEHVVRAAAVTTVENEFIIIGSQSILLRALEYSFTLCA